jgi:hypothetical protein
MYVQGEYELRTFFRQFTLGSTIEKSRWYPWSRPHSDRVSNGAPVRVRPNHLPHGRLFAARL